ncbi:cbb3-type cytochrome c oxidase subunit 3 [Tardiphaga sp. 841_E9_N1_2]|jgi:cytochrome c oxidase cbb3-type subunit 4|uniref:cbb3-type cytochrome c oxidase subunit 3 n=2 Tax=Tardiphaga TaxID=1395974 RepID=UPI003F234F7C
MMEHEATVWFAKSFGLFYLIAMSIGVVVYAYWPKNKKSFDSAAQSILDPSVEDKPYEAKRWQ